MVCLRYIISKSKNMKGTEQNMTIEGQERKPFQSQLSSHLWAFLSMIFSKNSDELGFKCRFLCCLGLEVSSCDV